MQCCSFLQDSLRAPFALGSQDSYQIHLQAFNAGSEKKIFSPHALPAILFPLLTSEQTNT